MVIQFWGAARTVTGSMHLLHLEDGKKILLDCGLYQGGGEAAHTYNREFPCDPAEIDLMILSHAHIDHCGNIPQLVKAGFKGRIYCTAATMDLAKVLLLDSAKIQEMDAEHVNRRRTREGIPLVEPLYTVRDVEPALNSFFTLPYDKWCKVDSHVEVLFLDAGHMLGSASVSLVIHEGERKIRLGFTGDIGRKDTPILRDPVPMPACDFLISESTYGGSVHAAIPEAEDHFLQIIHDTCVVRGGKLIIPAFSVGRTQSLVYSLDRLQSEGKLPQIPVYVDSPLALNATNVYELHPECFDRETLEHIEYHPDPFGFNGLNYVRKTEDSKALNARRDPMIVISSHGMVSAGRIMHHVAHTIEDSRNTILIVGYCAKGTLGAQLVEGAKRVRIHGQDYEVKASVRKLNSYSGHADEVEMYDFIRASQDPGEVKQIFLVHGEEERATAFQQFLKGKGYRNVVVPARGEKIRL